MGKKGRIAKGVPGMEQLVCRNPKAASHFEIISKMEAGMVLLGSEVKSLRQGNGDLDGAYASFERDELYLNKMHIAPYKQAGPYAHDTRRKRKLLLHRRELERLRGRITERGLTLIPLQVYFKNGVAKVQLALAKAKKLHDERESIKRSLDIKDAREAMMKRRK